MARRRKPWNPNEPARDALYRKFAEHLKATDNCVTFLLNELRALQARVGQLEKRNAISDTKLDHHDLGCIR
jgi:hypothetical protein